MTTERSAGAQPVSTPEDGQNVSTPGAPPIATPPAPRPRTPEDGLAISTPEQGAPPVTTRG